jgi:hypothetical protein
MKTVKLFLVAALCLASVGLANGQTVIRLTGSTAYRANVHNAITHILSSGFTYAYSGASLGGSQYAIFHGTVGADSVTIKTSWSGSEGGLQTVSHQDNVLFYNDSVAGTTGGTPNVGTPSGGNSATEVPDVAMSDTFQSSSAFFGLFRGQLYPTLSESPNSPVGVVPFKFVVAKTSAGGPPAGLTNISFQLARTLFSTGQMALSMFTGNNADETFTVFATGRDPDSGTRLTATSETGLGATATVKQYQPQNAGGGVITTSGGTIDHFSPWPASVVNGIPVSTFNGGYASGGQLAAAMGNNTPAGTTVITYLGTNDANSTAIPAGAVELSYNGVTLGGTSATDYNTVTALTEGKYSFWGYEHLYYRNGTGGVVKTVADTVANQLKTTDAVVLLGNMKVSRTTDGAKITQNF